VARYFFFFSVWGEHSETHKWPRAQAGRRASQKPAEERPMSRGAQRKSGTHRESARRGFQRDTHGTSTCPSNKQCESPSQHFHSPHYTQTTVCAAVYILLLHKHHCTCKTTQLAAPPMVQLVVLHPCICILVHTFVTQTSVYLQDHITSCTADDSPSYMTSLHLYYYFIYYCYTNISVLARPI
jgi:hypothetical protein